MKKRRIVIASVLKPVDDTRTFEKIAVSLSDSGGYEVFMIGFPTNGKPAYPNIQFLPSRSFHRLSLYRVILPWIILKKIYKVRPEVLIVNTHELLIVAVLIRIFFGTKIIYDVQENYVLNLYFENTFPFPLKQFLTLWVWGKETLLAPFFNWFFLAEKCYEVELRFPGNRKTILENKAKLPAGFTRASRPGKTRLVFTGTFSESTGVFKAIDLSRQLHQIDNTVSLTLVGYAAKSATLDKIRKEIAGCSFITLIGGDQLVPHSTIYSVLSEADFGVVDYELKQNTIGRMPTKVYEYLACQLPMLVGGTPLWANFCKAFSAVIPIGDPAQTLQAMKTRQFYTHPPTHIDWHAESQRMLKALEKI